MASVPVARQSAIRRRQTLAYVQAVDEPQSVDPRAQTVYLYKKLLTVPSLSQTQRLPVVVLLYQGMHMRLTTALQQPFAVQDAECTLVGFEPDLADQHTNRKRRAPRCAYLNERDCT